MSCARLMESQNYNLNDLLRIMTMDAPKQLCSEHESFIIPASTPHLRWVASVLIICKNSLSRLCFWREWCVILIYMFYSFHNVDVYFFVFGICGLDWSLLVESLGLLCRRWQTTCLWLCRFQRRKELRTLYGFVSSVLFLVSLVGEQCWSFQKLILYETIIMGQDSFSFFLVMLCIGCL